MKVSSSLRAVIYRRVSTDRQADSRLGLEAQLESCLAYAKSSSLSVTDSFADEGVSTSLGMADRPGLLAAIDALQRGDILLIAKVDRIGRDFIEVALIERMIQKKGCRIISAAGEGTENDDPASILLRRLMAAFAEHEKLIIALRTRAALRAKRARGERAGNVPFGYSALPDGKLIPSERELKTLELVRELRDMGYSLRDVVDELRVRGVTGRTGRPLTLKRVHAISRVA